VQGLHGSDTFIETMRSRAAEAGRPLGTAVEAMMQRLRCLMSASSEQSAALSADTSASGAEPGSATEEMLGFLAAAQGAGELGRLGAYRVLKVLGQGGMGMVLLAEDVQLKRPVALKVMKPELAKKQVARTRFLREAQAAAGLRHDHIVTIYQVGEEHGAPYLAMELMEGLSLEDWLHKGKQPNLRHVLRIGREIALGLAAAHARGLVHRDIKPANVWLDSAHQGRVRILDFGLARGLDDEVHLTQSGAIIGTPAYMAPEQARGEKVDARTDLFSLGVVLYRLTTGRLPFQGANTMAVLTALAMDTPPAPVVINHDLPAALSDLIVQLLSKDPAQRPQSAKEVAEALLAIDSGLTAAPTAVAVPMLVREAEPMRVVRPATSLPPSPPAASAGRSRRRWLVAAALLAVLGPLAWFFGPTIFRVVTNKGELVVRVEDPDIEVAVKQNGLVVEQKSGKRTFVLTAADGQIEVFEKDGVQLLTKEFKLSRGGKTTVTVTLKDLADARKPGEGGPVRPDEPKVALQDRDSPFALVRGGKVEREFKSFAGVHAEMRKGDVIEVHGNGPFAVGLVKVGEEGLTLRAGPGYRPRFVMEKTLLPTPHAGAWFTMTGAPVQVEGCDFECLAGVWGLFSGGGEPWEFTRCRFQTGDVGLAGYEGPRLRFTDCLISAPTWAHNGTLVNGKIKEFELNNCVLNTFHSLLQLEDVGATVRIRRSTVRVGNLVQVTKNWKRPITIEATESIFKAGSLVPLARKDLVRWLGSHNLYLGTALELRGADRKEISKDLAGWNRFWGREEEGSMQAGDVHFTWDEARTRKTSAAALDVFRRRTASVRQRYGAGFADLGPDWDLVGPGEAYVRALAAEGRPVARADLRPEVWAEGPVVLIRGGKELRAFRTIPEAEAAAETGDVIELRTDGTFLNVELPGAKTLTLRAGPGYRPVIEGFAFARGSNLALRLEGIDFRNSGFPLWGGSHITVFRIANCAFHPGMQVAAGAVLFRGPEGRPAEIVNCLMPGALVCDLPSNNTLAIRNSVIGNVQFQHDQPDREQRRIELDRCVQWCPEAESTLDLGRGYLEQKDPVAITARQTLFESGATLVSISNPERTTLERWTGSRNVYRKLAGVWLVPAKSPDIDLPDWRGRWKSDADSVQADPLLMDPQQWRLLPDSPGAKKGPDGKDIGADVDRIGKLLP
jgi:serine/threonine protein kinase